MRRFAQIVELGASRHHRYHYVASDRTPGWLRGLLAMVLDYQRASISNARRSGKAALGELAPFGILTGPRVVEMLEADGQDGALVYDILFDDGDLGYRNSQETWSGLPDLDDVLEADPDAFARALGHLKPKARAYMLHLVPRHGLLARDAYFETVFAALKDNARVPRDAALAVLRKADPERVLTRAKVGLADASRDDRLAAVRALAALAATGDEESAALLDAHAETETSKPILREMETSANTRATLASGPLAAGASSGDDRADGLEGYTAVGGAFVAAPPLAEEPGGEVPDGFEAELVALMEATNAAAREEHDALSAERRKTMRLPGFRAPLEPEDARWLVAKMRGEALSDDRRAAAWKAVHPNLPWHLQRASRSHAAGLAALFSRSDLALRPLVRASLHRGRQENVAWRDVFAGAFYPSDHSGPVTKARIDRLREGADLRVVFEEAEAQLFSVARALEEMVGGWMVAGSTIETRANPTIWAALLPHLNRLETWLQAGASVKRYEYSRDNALALLALFPSLPNRYLSAVLDIAGEGRRALRDRARMLLDGIEGLTPIIAERLKDGRKQARIDAARWLGERREAEAIPYLRAALGKEKDVVAVAAIVSALADCGDDISDQFAPERLIEEAEAGLAKTKADYSRLLERKTLPKLHWEDGGEVPDKVVEWWFARAHKLKSPAGDPLLHLALRRLRRADAEAMGRQVLAAWIAFDTRRPTGEEADAFAAEHAPGSFAARKKWAKDLTEETVFRELRRAHLSTYLDSAQDHRGLLALTRHAPPADMAAMGRRYLKDHGARAPQAKAILEAMAANPAPTVLQVILTASQRHKQPGGRKLAGVLAARIAEENGWTQDQMADRTVPTAGLDETGVLALPIGERTFEARLAEDAKLGLKLALLNPDGKAIASLPSSKATAVGPDNDAPNQDEAAEAKAAKAALTAARKELKQTVELQTARLYEAMCAGRCWPREEFETYVLGHPIVGRLAQRMVFLARDEAGEAGPTFRPLDDGTLSDACDAPVERAGGTVEIAHRATLGEEAADAWATHLEDYEVRPLLDQFGKPLLKLGIDVPKDATQIDDRAGHMIEAMALRGLATKLGWQRGSVEDGGTYYAYEKALPTLGLSAVVEFTGTWIGQSEPQPAALRELKFVRTREGGAGWGADGIRLDAVPPILLAEARGDYHAMAAAGTGFDADWEKKTW